MNKCKPKRTKCYAKHCSSVIKKYSIIHHYTGICVSEFITGCEVLSLLLISINKKFHNATSQHINYIRKGGVVIQSQS